jgi:biopolymer transport protein ExbD
MPVKTPGRRAGSGIALRQVKRNMEAKAARSLTASLNLTSMVDFMAVIVIFLLMNFSASGDFTYNPADIVPPDAAYGEELVRVPVIAVSASEVLFEQVRVESSRAVMAETDDYTLPHLTEALKREQEAFKEIRRGEEFDGKILIQADEGVPYKLIRRVFLAAAKVGYANISYVVRAKSKGN